MADITPKSDIRKQSVYFQDEMLAEIRAEAARLDRSISWVVQRAWKAGRIGVRKIGDSPVYDEE